jgi:hypothetical protein
MTSSRHMAMIMALFITFGLLAIIALGAFCEAQILSTSAHCNLFPGVVSTARPGIFQRPATPTLAPPREEYFAQQASNREASAKQRSIFLHIEADSDDIEVGWASP